MNRRRSRVGLSCCLLMMAMLCVVFPAVGSLPDTIDQIRGSVVAIGSVRPVKATRAKGPPLKFTGTGFAVGDGRHVVTNLHVLPQELDADNQEVLAVFSGRGESARVLKARIVSVDEMHDLALLSVEGQRLPAMKLADDNYLREGSSVAFTGFPIGMVLGLYPVTHRAIVSAVTPYVIPAHSSSTLTAVQIQRLRQPFEVYQLDAIAYPGNSGSPLYNPDDGRIVGVVNSVFVKESKESLLDKPSGITYAIPIKYVKKLMQVLNDQ